MKFKLLPLLLLIVLWSCNPQTKQSEPPATSLTKELKELRPGILEGYLSQSEYPNSLLLVPPPPEEGSKAYEHDQEYAAKCLGLDDDARKAQAVKDNVLHFPEAAEAFNIVLETKISEQATPHLYMILRRTLADAGLSTYTAKDHYQRDRPFVVNGTPILVPDEEEMLRGDGSYPSGHTAIGWAWALILTEVFPDEAEEILERGKQFGISRNICNVHWYSDVVAGRMMGAAAVAKLHGNADFLIDLEAAKAEVEAINAPV